MRHFFRLGGGEPQPYNGPISGNNEIDPYRPEDIITIKHANNEYLFKYPVDTIASHALNIGHVREKCAEITGVDVKKLSLICAGRTLRDDNATLQTLGIEHGAKVLAVGTNAAPVSMPEQHKEPTLSSVKLGPAQKIESVRDHVVIGLLPLVDDFINGPKTDKRADAHRRLSETIMAELLKLDGVETEDPQIRARRKEVVKEIQGYLDALDKSLKDSL